MRGCLGGTVWRFGRRSTLAAVVLAATAQAQSPQAFDPSELEAAEQAAQAAQDRRAALAAQADRAQAGLARIRADLVAAAEAVSTQEAALNRIDARLATLRAQEAERLTRLAANETALLDVLAALQRFERGRPPALAVSPDDALKAARAAGLLAETTPSLTQRTQAVKADLLALVEARTAIEAERGAQLEAEASLATEQAAVERLLAERERETAALRDQARAADREARALVDQAESLRALVAALTERARTVRPRLKPERRPIPAPTPQPVIAQTAPEPPPAEAETPPGAFAQLRGRLPAPAEGPRQVRFGEPRPGGGVWEGLTVSTRPGAQVIAPVNARVGYAGPFPVYGNLLILFASEDYVIILGGMAEMSVVVQQQVSAGEPVGRMPDRVDPPSELYVELQRRGEPIDPGPWFRADAPA
ncbi:MAG: murein hydrolase activator EnvC family protein [Maricaulaceae bacterium]